LQMVIAMNVLDLIGNTPMVQLSRVTSESKGWILGKCEFMNPTGSLKDRIALEMIEDAEQRGEITPGYTKLIEATTGNTGISLAAIGSIKGYEVVIVMTEDTNQEIQQLVAHFGAKVVLTPVEGIVLDRLQTGKQAINREKAARMVRNQIAANMVEADPWMYMLNQSANRANVRAHRQTGKEILEQTQGKVDVFVAGIGTGGSLMGISQVLREVNPLVRIVAVEPAEAAMDSAAEPTIYGIQGVSDDVIPAILDLSKVDEIIRVTSAQAWHMASRLAREEGLSVGPSSGANVWAALLVLEKIGCDHSVVTLLPDQASRYFSLNYFLEQQEC
jgi:cysteine synthase A